MTLRVTTTTSQTRQPPNEPAANFQTPVITPTSKVTTQRSPSAQTQSDAAFVSDTTGGPSDTIRAAQETVANTCTPTAQSPPCDTVSSDTTGRTITPRLPDNVRVNEVKSRINPTPTTPTAPPTVTDTATQAAPSPTKLQDIPPGQLLYMTKRGFPSDTSRPGSLPDRIEVNQSTTQADPATRPTAADASVIPPDYRLYSQVICNTSHTDISTHPVTSNSTGASRLSATSPRLTRQSTNAHADGWKSFTIDTWLSKLPPKTRTTRKMTDLRPPNPRQKAGQGKKS